MTPDIDDSQVLAALAARLERVLAEPPCARTLQTRLLDRVRASIAAHGEYTTIRVEDGAWQPGAGGVLQRVLRSDAGVRVEVQRLASGAVLAWPEDVDAQEILLLEGSLTGMRGSEAATGLPGALGYCVRLRANCEDVLTATADSTLYVRHRLTPATTLPPLEAHWWQLGITPPIWLDPGRMRWRASSEGVDVLPLCGNSDVVSMLVRFQAGASVPDHGHAIDEDCLVLRGEMFLGDILLRAGDYQLAPAGGSHFNETSDVGVLFYFHGAIDPVLRGEPRPQ